MCILRYSSEFNCFLISYLSHYLPDPIFKSFLVNYQPLLCSVDFHRITNFDRNPGFTQLNVFYKYIISIFSNYNLSAYLLFKCLNHKKISNINSVDPFILCNCINFKAIY